MTVMPGPTVLAAGLTFTESPRWHAGRLWFADRYAVRAVDIAGRVEEIVAVPDGVGGLGFRSDGGFLFVSTGGRRLCRLAGDRAETVVDLSGLEPVRSGDMVVDARGRAYIGGHGFNLNGG